MSVESIKLFEVVRKFKQLNIAESLNLMPQSEMVLMRVLMETSKVNGNGSSVSEIAKLLQVSPPAISRTLKKLREKHFVDSSIDETDRRNTYIVITKEGKAALHKNILEMGDFIRLTLTHLEPGELEQFCLLFDKVYEGMQEEMKRLGKG